MVNRIFGVISDIARGGIPLGNLRVRVWDRDWPDGDDLLAETFTSADGRYEASYSTKSWDLNTGIFGLGRPDIYITAENQSGTGKWIKLGESSVHHNHDMNQDLRIDLALRMGIPISKRTDFVTEVHGFRFKNSFQVTADFLGVDLGRWNMGFCGGMCSGALYRFLNSIPSPMDIESPSEDTALHRELKRRQLRAMSPKMLPKMFEWQASPNTSRFTRKQSIGERTRSEWPELKKALDEGKPMIIVLIRASGLLSNPTDNHQVLAIGYDYNPMTMDLALQVYDPNVPEQTQTISLNLGLPEGKMDLVDSASPKTRGFFVSPVGEETTKMENVV